MSNLGAAPTSKRITSVTTLHFGDMTSPPMVQVGGEIEPHSLFQAVVTLVANTSTASITWTWYDRYGKPSAWYGSVDDLVDESDRQDMQRLIDEARVELDRIRATN